MIIRLALKSLWCDIKHSCKGIEIVGLIASILYFLVVLSGTVSNVFLFVWAIELGMRRLVPICEKAYFVLPLSKEDRARLMRWRAGIAELGMLLLFGIFLLAYQLIFSRSCGAIQVWQGETMLVPLMMLVTFSACFFCGYYPEADIKEKAVGVLLGILCWAAFVVGVLLADSGENYYFASILLCILSLIGISSIKLYFMLHAHYEEYRYVNLMYEDNRKEKEKEQLW